MSGHIDGKLLEMALQGAGIESIAGNKSGVGNPEKTGESMIINNLFGGNKEVCFPPSIWTLNVRNLEG